MDGTSTLNEWPRRLVPQNMHYLVHKVASAHVRDDQRLSFLFKHEDGRTYHGPFYPSFVNGQRPLASRVLEKNGIAHLNEIKYVVAYHSGAFPNGLPQRLLKSEEDLNGIVARATGASDDGVGGIVGWLGLPKS